MALFAILVFSCFIIFFYTSVMVLISKLTHIREGVMDSCIRICYRYDTAMFSVSYYWIRWYNNSDLHCMNYSFNVSVQCLSPEISARWYSYSRKQEVSCSDTKVEVGCSPEGYTLALKLIRSIWVLRCNNTPISFRQQDLENLFASAQSVTHLQHPYKLFPWMAVRYFSYMISAEPTPLTYTLT